MKKIHLYHVKTERSLRALLVSVGLFVLLIAGFLSAVGAARTDRAEEAAAQLETAIRRACVTCYAVEGRYPQNLAYLESKYGILIDRQAYLVRYDAFAENLLPDISVTVREEVRG